MLNLKISWIGKDIGGKEITANPESIRETQFSLSCVLRRREWFMAHILFFIVFHLMTQIDYLCNTQGRKQGAAKG